MLQTRRSAPEGTPWDFVSQAETPLNVPIDSNGNLTQKTENGHVWGYEWNAENQLVRVTKDAAEIATFKYDPIGRRVEKVAGGVATTYTYAEEDILKETNGVMTYTYVHGPGFDEPIARDSGTVLAYYHVDGLGSVVKMTDSTGAIVHEYQYNAWGDIGIGGNVGGHAFTGREWDFETQLYYYRARYYNPRVGRFLGEDPFEIAVGDVNAYSYATSNPIRWKDPLGLFPSGPAGAFTIYHHVDDYAKHPPSLKCFLWCVPSVYLDDIIALGAGGGMRRLPFKICKRIGGFTMKKIVPVLGLLNLPTYVGCVWTCRRLEADECESNNEPPPCPGG